MVRRLILVTKIFNSIATYNPGHNILELDDVLVQVRFIASKAKRYI